VPTSAVPTSATGKIAAGGLEHIVAPHLQRNKHVDYELTTSSRSRAVSTVKAANASSRPASSQTRGGQRERARPTTSRSHERIPRWFWVLDLARAAAQLVCRRRSTQQLGAGADDPHTARKISRRPFTTCRTSRPTPESTHATRP